MIDNRVIRQTLRIQLRTVAGLPADAAQSWENRAFNPPNPPAPWIRATLLPVSERLIATNQVMGIGIFVVDVFVPVASGTETAEDLSLAIANAFKPASSLVGVGVTISLYRTERKPALVMDEIWYHVPIHINYRTFIQNN